MPPTIDPALLRAARARWQRLLLEFFLCADERRSAVLWDQFDAAIAHAARLEAIARTRGVRR